MVAPCARRAGRGGKAALHEPRFPGNEKRYVDDCIDTGWVSSAGGFVDRFEADAGGKLRGRARHRRVNGTVALQVALRAAGVAPGDEVFVPALTFVATANAVGSSRRRAAFRRLRRSQPRLSRRLRSPRHLREIGERRNGACINRITGRPIAALLPVHIFGHPADMDCSDAIAREYDLAVVEDATEALGSRYKGRPCGALSGLATLSFNGNKIVTTGGGGAILTDGDRLAESVQHLHHDREAAARWAFEHDEIGWNFRLPNINAALGFAQLEQLAGYARRQSAVSIALPREFRRLRRLAYLRRAAFCRKAITGSYRWFSIARCESDLEPILAATNDAGIATRPVWTPMHRLPMYRTHPRATLPVTESLARRIISLPSSPFLAPP